MASDMAMIMHRDNDTSVIRGPVTMKAGRGNLMRQQSRLPPEDYHIFNSNLKQQNTPNDSNETIWDATSRKTIEVLLKSGCIMEKIYTRREAAAMLGISIATLDAARINGHIT